MKFPKFSAETFQNEKEYRDALRRRMEAYRWLIDMKQNKKISANVDIKLILAGKVILPDNVLRNKPEHIDLERLKWDTIGKMMHVNHSNIKDKSKLTE
jgi:hypothetical protein